MMTSIIIIAINMLRNVLYSILKFHMLDFLILTYVNYLLTSSLSLLFPFEIASWAVKNLGVYLVLFKINPALVA